MRWPFLLPSMSRATTHQIDVELPSSLIANYVSSIRVQVQEHKYKNYIDTHTKKLGFSCVYLIALLLDVQGIEIPIHRVNNTHPHIHTSIHAFIHCMHTYIHRVNNKHIQKFNNTHTHKPHVNEMHMNKGNTQKLTIHRNGVNTHTRTY